MSRVEIDIAMGTAEIAYALAVGEAYRDAADRIGERYAIDEVARSKVIGLVVKVAKSRMRSGHYILDRSDIETVAVVAARHFIHLKSSS